MGIPGWLAYLDSMGFVTMRLLISILWQSSILLITIGVMLFLLRRKNVPFGFFLLVTALLIIPLIPLLTFFAAQSGTPQASLDVFPDYLSPRTRIAQTQLKMHMPARQRFYGLVNPYSHDFSLPKPVTQAITEMDGEQVENAILSLSNFPWATALLVYLCIVFIFLAWIAVTRLRIRKWISESEVVYNPRIETIFRLVKERLSLNKEYTLVENDDISAPFTCRIFHPVIILPACYIENLSDNELRAVAIHELTHIQRNDILFLTIVSFIRAFFFFHPLVWLAARNVSFLAEIACDNAVLDMQVKSSSYAGMLTRLAVNIPARPVSAELAAGMLFCKSPFFQRIESILSDRRSRLSRAAFSGIVMAAILSLALSIVLPLGYAGENGNSVRITGKVIYKGQPVSEAEIFFNNVVSEQINKVNITGKDGTFSFKTDRFNLSGEDFSRPSIIAYSSGHAIGWMTLTGSTDKKNVVIQLKDTTEFSGTVEDASGNPLAGAEVSIVRLHTPSQYYSSSLVIQPGSFAPLTTKTDESGSYNIQLIPERSIVYIIVQKRSYANISSTLNHAGLKNNTITMNHGGSISGRVVRGDTGTPLKNIKIVAVQPGGMYINTETTTDKYGKYTLHGLSVGHCSVFVSSCDEMNDVTAPTRDKVPIFSGQTTYNVDFALERGGFVTGNIVDDTGKPIASHWIGYHNHTQYEHERAMRYTKTDENGRYLLHVPPGFTRIFTEAPEGFEKVGRIKREIEVAAGDTVEVEQFQFTKGITLIGIARTYDGTPVEGVTISGKDVYSVTRSDGLFTISGLTRGKKLNLDAIEPELELRGTIEIELQSDTTVEILLDEYETATITGRVFDNDGNPIAGANASIIWWSRRNKAGEETDTAFTDEMGTYTLDGIIVGDIHMIFVSAQGFASPQISRADEFIAERDMPPYKDVILEKSNRWLEGRLVNDNNEPLAGALVYVFQGSDGQSKTTSDGNGRFRLDNLRGIMVDNMHVRHNDYGSFRFSYVPTNLMNKFTLAKGTHCIAGKVVDNDGNPIEKVHVSPDYSIRDNGQTISSVRTDSEGRFRLENIAENTMSLDATHKDYKYTQIKNIQTDSVDIVFVMDNKSLMKENRLSDDVSSPLEPFAVHREHGEAAISVDGILSDWEGCAAETIDIRGINPDIQESVFHIPVNDDELSATARILSDDSYIYIAVDVTDDEPVPNNRPFSQVWSDDCVEMVFYGDMKEKREAVLQIAADNKGGTRFEGHIPSTEEKCPYLWEELGAQVVLRQTKAGYAVECAIPWSVLDYGGWEKERLMGMNIRVYDLDRKELSRNMVEWATVPGMSYRELSFTDGGGVKDNSYRAEHCDAVFDFFELINAGEWDGVEQKLDSFGDGFWTQPLRAIVYQCMNNEEGYNTVMSRILREADDDYVSDWILAVLFDKASRLESSGQYEKAAALLEPVIDRCPRTRNRFDAHLLLGSCYVNISKYYDARRHLREVVNAGQELENIFGGARTRASAEKIIESLDRIAEAGK
ncbi:carboxypeptidase regulatory-like domain-containing protein [Candidatus Omnitrophota bacterium]